MSTIGEVASLAGVSIKTVSRVLNNEKYVSPNTRIRVESAISDSNYKPNVAARQLAGNRSFAIVLLIDGSCISYFDRIVRSAASECKSFGYSLLIEPYVSAADCDSTIVSMLEFIRPDGIILAPPYWQNLQMIRSIERSGTPFVFLDNVSDGHGATSIDAERDASFALVSHLLKNGHRRIAMIAPPVEHSMASGRLKGYLDALINFGVDVNGKLISRGNMSFAGGARIASILLEQDMRPTAIFAANDSMALGALSSARRLGIKVPEDLAVAGFEDSPGATNIFPRLTSVRQPLDAMARAAIRILLGKPTGSIEMTYQLIIRRSTSLRPFLEP